MARLSTVSRERMDDIIKRFHSARQDNISLVEAPTEYVSQVLRKALGDEKANLLITGSCRAVMSRASSR